MRGLLLLLATACVTFADATDDIQWEKVKELATGSDIRVYGKGKHKPITAQAGEVTNERIVIVVKEEESAIARVDIDRIDVRAQAGQTGLPRHHPPRVPPPSKPHYKTIYKRANDRN